MNYKFDPALQQSAEKGFSRGQRTWFVPSSESSSSLPASPAEGTLNGFVVVLLHFLSADYECDDLAQLKVFHSNTQAHCAVHYPEKSKEVLITNFNTLCPVAFSPCRGDVAKSLEGKPSPQLADQNQTERKLSPHPIPSRSYKLIPGFWSIYRLPPERQAMRCGADRRRRWPTVSRCPETFRTDVHQGASACALARFCTCFMRQPIRRNDLNLSQPAATADR